MAENEKSPRGQSTIQFPYKDLESAIETAKAIHDSGAVSGVAPDQLAALLGITGGTGNFMTRVATARMFGLIGNSTPYQLTELGYEVLDKDERRRRAAWARAFLTVPLYRRLHDTYRGRALPSRPQGLERAFMDLGVAPKSAKPARQAFDRSAKHAGFFGAGEDRLVEPVPGAAAERPSQRHDNRPAAPTPAPPPPPPAERPLPLLVQGMLEQIPRDTAAGWPLAERIEWLRAAVHNFNLIFKNVGEINVSGPSSGKPSAAPVAAPSGGRPAPQAESRPATRRDIDDDFAPPPSGGGRPAPRSKAELDDDIPF